MDFNGRPFGNGLTGRHGEEGYPRSWRFTKSKIGPLRRPYTAMDQSLLTRRDPTECGRGGWEPDLHEWSQTSVDVVLQGVLQGASKLRKSFRIKVVGSEGIEPPTNSV